MKLTLLKDLKNNEILAKDIITGNGDILLKKNTKITINIRKKLNSKVFILYM